MASALVCCACGDSDELLRHFSQHHEGSEIDMEEANLYPVQYHKHMLHICSPLPVSSSCKDSFLKPSSYRDIKDLHYLIDWYFCPSTKEKNLREHSLLQRTTFVCCYSYIRAWFHRKIWVALIDPCTGSIGSLAGAFHWWTASRAAL